MGDRMKPLPLSGQATVVKHAGYGNSSRMVLRLQEWQNQTVQPNAHDAALIRTSEDTLRAKAADFQMACIINDGESLDNNFERYVRLPEKFAYLGEGDIIGLDVHSKKLRVLFRQSSTHNAFLVTERCNHYCLMCSQPPRDPPVSEQLPRG
jgi:hypothetical protein